MNPKLIIKFDEEKDLKNIWETCNGESKYGINWKNAVTKNILEICENKPYKKSRPKLKKTMDYIYQNPINNTILKSFDDAWKIVGKEYFRRLERITKKSFVFNKVKVYLTTSRKCPYNPEKNDPYFFVSYFANVPRALQIMGHELMHIHLHNTNWWKKVEKEIGNDKTHDLKEALTVLLNLEFGDLWLVEDRGYPSHKKLREFISEQWKKKKDFDQLTNECIKWIKKNGIK